MILKIYNYISDNTIISAPSSPSNLSSVTLVGSTGSGSGSGSDRSPQEATYSRGASEETDTPVATDLPKKGNNYYIVFLDYIYKRILKVLFSITGNKFCERNAD